MKGKAVTIGDGYRQYFELFIHEEDGVFLFAKEKAEVIERERDLCGYFVIVTSKKMSAKEALELYRSRDASEKLFSGDKSYLGNKNLRVQSDEAPAAEDGYQGAMTLARKISLGKYRGEYRICQRFAGLPDPFQYPEVTAEQIDLDPDGALDLTVVSEDGSWIALGNDLGEELILSCSDTEWTIDRSPAGKGDFSGKFCSDRTGMNRFPKKFADGRLRMIFDRSILEMEGDDGLTSATIDVYPNAPYTKVRMSGLKNCRIGTVR